MSDVGLRIFLFPYGALFENAAEIPLLARRGARRAGWLITSLAKHRNGSVVFRRFQSTTPPLRGTPPVQEGNRVVLLKECPVVSFLSAIGYP